MRLEKIMEVINMKIHKIYPLILLFLNFGIVNCQVVSDFSQKKIEIDTNLVYSSYLLDENPIFKDGTDSLASVINQHFVAHTTQFGYEGIVIICLTINKSGILEDVNIIGDTENSIFSRIANNLKKYILNWYPGKKDKFHVKSLICLPIILKIK